VAAVLGEGKTPLEIARMSDIPVPDRLWCLLHNEVITPDRASSLAQIFADHVAKLDNICTMANAASVWAKASWSSRKVAGEMAIATAASAAWAMAKHAAQVAALEGREYSKWKIAAENAEHNERKWQLAQVIKEMKQLDPR
jgi:hypothetical protein